MRKDCETCKHNGEDYLSDDSYCNKCIMERVLKGTLGGYEAVSAPDEHKADFEAHYGGSIQPLEFMQAQLTPEEFKGFLKGNIIKYTARCGKKDDPVKELAKVLRYAAWLKQAEEGKKIDPRN